MALTTELLKEMKDNGKKRVTSQKRTAQPIQKTSQKAEPVATASSTEKNSKTMKDSVTASAGKSMSEETTTATPGNQPKKSAKSRKSAK